MAGKYIYRRIKDLRIDNDKKQKEISDYLGITQQQYSLYENGEREIPFHLVIGIAKLYNISLDYIASIVENPKPFENQNKKELTAKQLALLEAYESKKEFQKTIDKLLDIQWKQYKIYSKKRNQQHFNREE